MNANGADEAPPKTATPEQLRAALNIALGQRNEWASRAQNLSIDLALSTAEIERLEREIAGLRHESSGVAVNAHLASD